MPAHVDLSGQVFYGVVVLRESHQDSRTAWHYECRCRCGAVFVVDGYRLKRGHTRSCGCLLESRKHGWVGSSEYGIWNAMKMRAGNPNVKAFADYGGRGITVCERWRDFRAFIADMGPRPSARHSLERRDNALGYSPQNCYWATPYEQASNRRNNVRLTLGAVTKTVKEWATHLGAQDGTLHARLKRGWSVERTLSVPIRKCVRVKDR